MLLDYTSFFSCKQHYLLNRTSCTDEEGHQLIMRMLIKLWTKPELKTRTSSKQKPHSKCAVRSLRKSLNLQNKVLYIYISFKLGVRVYKEDLQGRDAFIMLQLVRKPCTLIVHNNYVQEMNWTVGLLIKSHWSKTWLHRSIHFKDHF